MKNEVYLIDCMEFMKGVPDKYYELAIIDPPYGIGDKLTQGGTWASKYAKGDASWDIAPPSNYWNELFRVSKNQIVWGGNYFGLPPNRCFIIWDKVAHMDTLADCEMAWTSFDKNARFISINKDKGTEERLHICQKPIALYLWLLNNYAKEGDKIFDSHVGSGSSRIACDKLGYYFEGCELDKDYWEAQEKRYKDYKSQLTINYDEI